VDLAGLTGTGPDGAIRAADIQKDRTADVAKDGTADKRAKRRRPPKPAPPAAGRTAGEDGQTAMRAAIGKLMSRAKREIPHYYLASTLDLGGALAWLARHNADLPISERVLPIALLLRATALAAADHPDVNGHFIENAFHPAPTVNLGVPVSLRSGGLVTPVIEAADKLALPELNARLRDTATRAKTGRLRGSEIGEPTITVTNLGDQGVEAVFGVIYPPQVALVGFGSIVERPWAIDGMLGVRPVVTATLSADHRVSDGHRGALFLKSIMNHLTEPEQL
jgi:pyruvate dehydrogenase E2 component (dihydrolipoamide acetyltransferase)